MSPPLFLVPDLGSGDQIELTGAEAHHAGTVTRLAVGERALLADGRGGLAEVVVVAVERDRVRCAVERRSQVREPRPRFVVVQALPKGERAELVVEVLTELGVDEIVPWSAARSIGAWKGDKLDKGLAKWRRTALAAAKQSRRPRIPLISELAGTAEVARRVRAAGLAILLHESAECGLEQVLQTAGTAGRHAGPGPDELAEVLVVVGPEGGIAPEELALLQAEGARCARLGPEVLRTSTAGAAALAVLSVALGRWAAG
ncbi:MAG: 16S rRNA (uracil(1498)-N(3))-methyltransferase [Jatrophihabitans sp.]